MGFDTAYEAITEENDTERWAYGTEQLLIEKGILTREEIDAKMAELESTWGVS